MTEYSKKEFEICDEFKKVAQAQGWTFYPECAPWDFLLQWEGEDQDIPLGGRYPVTRITKGTQIGVQSKARPNFVVIQQTLDSRLNKEKTHYSAVLVPKTVAGFSEVCNACGIAVFTPDMSPESLAVQINRAKFEESEHRVWTPTIATDLLKAGVASPKQLTKWKENALIITWLLRNRGYVSTHDFTSRGIDITLWRKSNWIKRNGKVMIMFGGFGSSEAKYELPKELPDDFPDLGDDWAQIRDELAIAHGLK